MASLVINRVVLPAKATLPWTLALAVVWMLTVDALTRVGFGPVSLAGAITLAGAVICVVVSPTIFLNVHASPNPTQRGPIPLALTFFAFYAVFRLMSAPSTAGVQNVAVLITFILTIGLTAISINRANIERFGKWLRLSAVVTSSTAIVAILTGSDLYGTRTFALAAVVFLAILVPHRPRCVLARFTPVLPFVGIALSLSRVALAIGAVDLRGS